MRLFIGFLFVFFLVCDSHAVETRGLRVVAKDPASGQTGEVKLYNKSYAVIIGIDRYKNLSPDRQLKNAVKDAKGIEATIRKQYRFDRIFSLHDQQASRDAIMRLLTSELPGIIGKEDALFIFWAGHGNQVKTDDGDLGYLIPHDGNASGIYGNITMSQLKDDISRAIPAKHIFYAFDACYSGLLTSRGVDAKASRNLAYLKTITKERVRQVLTAGSKGQEALDGGPRGHSVFTGRLIEVLEATGDYITANEIQAILKERVYQDARARGHEQTPGFGALYGGGDFVFVPNIEQKVQDNRAELARIEAELKQLEAQESEARKHQTEQQQREAEQKKKTAQAQLKAEQLRQQQLAEEAKRQQEMVQERARFGAEQRRKEQEQTIAQQAEEKRLVALKAELAKKKQAAPATAAGSLAAAVAEIKRLNAEIAGIEAAFSKELGAGTQRITARYEKEIAAVRLASQQKQTPLVRDEFETEVEYRARVAKQSSRFTDRISQLETQKQQEIAGLQKRLADEQHTQTREQRQAVEKLANQQFTVGAEALVIELGTYDADKQLFPVSVSSKIPEVKLAMNGIIPLTRDAARKFKQEFVSGLVRPQASMMVGSGLVGDIALANDADSNRYNLYNGIFMSSNERMSFVFHDLKTDLLWLRNGNIAGKEMTWNEAMVWVKSLDILGYRDWRLPTKDELEIFAERGGKYPYRWLNANGFASVAASSYWSSSIFTDSTTEAWYVGMHTELVGHIIKSIRLNVWPVRDAK